MKRPAEPAAFRSYYGRPIIKTPTWKVPDVPAYLFLGGLAGASATMAALAGATRRPLLRRTGLLAAAGGAGASVVALVHDLGRPARFLNMLRVLKPTSPLSVGSWILAPFSALATAAAGSEITGLLPGTGRLAGVAAGLVGPAMTTYTAVLLADTAVPGWHEVHRGLPFLFAGSAVSSAGGLALLCVPTAEAGPARRMAVAGSALELAAEEVVLAEAGLIARAYRTGRPGRVLRVARALTAAGALAAAVGGHRRDVAAAAGLCLLIGGAATRFGVFDAGCDTARDPAYTVVPQRQRLGGQRPD
ncbi:NrfD/PsrC family molybdoenzyme membrane anchor subunit [Saccharopolyspora sp. MS10]|uniref:NrfD/PsrC family molybdoenzyme membrane anchor subunit n=1 Tax=Saccharopolyspora sp. MS10 TaxID=3385973 RepID=UPI0039A13620